jgi:hypothetical protein
VNAVTTVPSAGGFSHVIDALVADPAAFQEFFLYQGAVVKPRSAFIRPPL